MTFTVISYDVTDDRRRLRVAKVLEGVADRVQRSVFEGYLDERTLARTIRRLVRIIDAECDSVRIYRLCATCLGQVQTLGSGGIAPEEDTIVL